MSFSGKILLLKALEWKPTVLRIRNISLHICLGAIAIFLLCMSFDVFIKNKIYYLVDVFVWLILVSILFLIFLGLFLRFSVSLGKLHWDDGVLCLNGFKYELKDVKLELNCSPEVWQNKLDNGIKSLRDVHSWGNFLVIDGNKMEIKLKDRFLQKVALDNISAKGSSKYLDQTTGSIFRLYALMFH